MSYSEADALSLSEIDRACEEYAEWREQADRRKKRRR